MVLAVIQARMGSSRLPGKVMREVCAKPLIGHMFDRLMQSSRLDKIVLATSADPANDLLADYVGRLGYDVFRGSESNVLERFYLAAKPYAPQAVVRLTGDCVLIDAGIVDRVVNLFMESGADYAWADSSFAEGLDVEVLSFDALTAAYANATLKSELEHVTQYIHNNPHRFKRVPLANDVDDSAIRIVVDEPEDLVVVERILRHFMDASPDSYFEFAKIKDFLLKNSAIAQINTHVIRNEGLLKSLANDETVR